MFGSLTLAFVVLVLTVWFFIGVWVIPPPSHERPPTYQGVAMLSQCVFVFISAILYQVSRVAWVIEEERKESSIGYTTF
jgi:hypothetical protein